MLPGQFSRIAPTLSLITSGIRPFVGKSIIEGKKVNVLPKKSPIVAEKSEDEAKEETSEDTAKEDKNKEEIVEESKTEEKEEPAEKKSVSEKS